MNLNDTQNRKIVGCSGKRGPFVITVSFDAIIEETLSSVIAADRHLKKRPLPVELLKRLQAKAFKTGWGQVFFYYQAARNTSNIRSQL
jgi:hypothetical protein